MDPSEALQNVLSGGIYTLGSAGINAGVGAINGYSYPDLYPWAYGSGGYATPYSLGMQQPQQGIGLGALLLVGVVVWLVARK